MIVRKKCTTCKRRKKQQEFHKKTASRDGIVARCKVCQAAYHANWYQKSATRHKRLVRKRQKRNIVDNRNNRLQYLAGKSCVDCLETDPIVLQFDHVRGTKRATVSALIGNGSTWKRVLREIALCEIRCSNCHLRRTATQLGWYAAIVAQG